MNGLMEATRQRLEHWETRLQRALTRSSPAAQARIQRELMELWDRKHALPELSEEQLRTLHTHLQREPSEWLKTPMASAA